MYKHEGSIGFGRLKILYLHNVIN